MSRTDTAEMLEDTKAPTSRRADGRARMMPTQAIEFYAIGLNALLILLLTLFVLETLNVTSLESLAASAGLILVVILGVLAVGGLVIENIRDAKTGTHHTKKKAAPQPVEKDILGEALAVIEAVETLAPKATTVSFADPTRTVGVTSE